MKNQIDGLLLPVSLFQTDRFARLTKLAASLSEARAATDTNPSEAQAEAGNYRKGKYQWNGLTIAIENPKGSTRSGVDKNGKPWSVKLQHDYGYFLRSEGKDGDQVDVFIGPDRHCELVFVVNQIDPDTGLFDEVKVMVGFTNKQAATDGYLANYTKGWRGLGEIIPATLDQFREWLQNDSTHKFRLAKAKSREKAGAAWSEVSSRVPGVASDEGAMSHSDQQAV